MALQAEDMESCRATFTSVERVSSMISWRLAGRRFGRKGGRSAPCQEFAGEPPGRLTGRRTFGPPLREVGRWQVRGGTGTFCTMQTQAHGAGSAMITPSVTVKAARDSACAEGTIAAESLPQQVGREGRCLCATRIYGWSFAFIVWHCLLVSRRCGGGALASMKNFGAGRMLGR